MSAEPSQSANAKPSVSPATAHTLSGLTEYGDGAIVSRTLTKGKAGTLTLFAFDAGQSISEHSTPFDAWVHVIEGTGQLVIGGEEVRVEPGQIVLMPANVPHAVHAPDRFKMLLMMLKQEPPAAR